MADKHRHNIDSEISLTYITTSRKLTAVASLGVTIGVAIYIFMNSMAAGFSKKSDATMFKNVPHVRVYKDDEISAPLRAGAGNGALPVIVNPRVVPESQKIINPDQVLALLRQQPEVVIATPQVGVDVFYNSGRTQIAGTASGVIIEEADKMFSIAETMVEGRMEDLKSTPNGILVGVGVAQKMSVKTGDNITITSSRNVTKVMKVVGMFKTSNSNIDKTKSYINISTARQLKLESPSYVSDIDVNVKDYDNAARYSAQLSFLTGYKAEDWKAANETLVAAARMRTILINVISMSILLVAGFGIYNILNMTINQKINEIAILKAMGFQGRDVVRIFVQQAMMIGLGGIVMGSLLCSLLVYALQHVYVGGDIGYFPIHFEPQMYTRGIIFGLIITFFAGYFPARKASNVDPVSIFRK
ncbi:ABC transporter permease [Chitinophaga parva]|uniref:ABC transporter permease n=1 Tax=Chitinophaga parva TaxID=2169414 RepID=A0A2T7BHP0_9BACT|nr:FtsX-like permease family protein [Chitinophaga parva]PUZ25797.1 ABC transporter permease [Chitinophaga parva]